MSDKQQRRRAREFLSRVLNLSINVRLKDDITDVLVGSRDEAATPALVSLMALGYGHSGLSEKFNEPMRALVELGPAAVPELLRELQSADSVSWERAWVANFGCIFSREMVGAPAPRTRLAPGLSEESTDIDKQVITEVAKRKIRVRTVMVLGRIGDERALPTLEALLSTEPTGVTQYVEDAIHRIREKDKK